MELMSSVHVTAMNEALHDAADVRSVCAQPVRARVMSYRLTDGPDGEAVHWTTTSGRHSNSPSRSRPRPICVSWGTGNR